MSATLLTVTVMIRLRTLLATSLGAALLVPLLAGCGGSGSGDAQAGTGFVAGDGSLVLLDPSRRVPAPAVEGVTLDGTPLNLADYAGQVIVLNVWASWCAPCRAEAPILQGAWAEHEGEGVQVIGLNTRDTDVAARAFVQTFDIAFPSIVDADGRIQLLFRDSLPPQAIPSTLLIDQQGRVAGRILGEATDASLGSLINALLDEATSPSAAPTP